MSGLLGRGCDVSMVLIHGGRIAVFFDAIVGFSIPPRDAIYGSSRKPFPGVEGFVIRFCRGVLVESNPGAPFPTLQGGLCAVFFQ